MDVLVVGRRAVAIAATAALRSGIRSLTADVAHAEDIPRMVEAAASEHGRIDLLVNNAAVLRAATLEDTELQQAREMWATNVLAPTLLAKAALPYLVVSRGSIINVSSTFGGKPAPGVGQYEATKAALELADRGVRVNAVAPGPTESEGLERSVMSEGDIERVKAAERE